MKPIAYINVEKRTLEFAEPIKWHTPTVANLDRIPLFTKEALAQTQEPVAWMFKGIAGFKTHITDTQYQSLHQEEKKWYEPYKCVNCTHSQPKTEQEPVAWMNAITKEIYWRNQINSDVPNVPLYTHPQLKREWVGLTDEEIIRIKAAIKGTLDVQFGVFARAIEAKLKEKNT